MTKRDLVVAEWQLPDSTLRTCWNITQDNRARLVWSNPGFFRLLPLYLQYLLSYILASGPKPWGGGGGGGNKKA